MNYRPSITMNILLSYFCASHKRPLLVPWVAILCWHAYAQALYMCMCSSFGTNHSSNRCTVSKHVDINNHVKNDSFNIESKWQRFILCILCLPHDTLLFATGKTLCALFLCINFIMTDVLLALPSWGQWRENWSFWALKVTNSKCAVIFF